MLRYRLLVAIMFNSLNYCIYNLTAMVILSPPFPVLYETLAPIKSCELDIHYKQNLIAHVKIC